MYIVYDDLFSKTTSNYVIEDDSATPSLERKQKIQETLEGILGLIVILASLLVLCIGGIPTAWKATKRSARDKARDAADDWVADREGVGGSLMNSLIRGLVRIVLVVVIGSVAAPILLIIAVVKYVKSGKEIPVLQEQVDNFEI